MKNRHLKNISLSLCFLMTFILWTLLVRFVDVQPIGPQGSIVGFATWNGYVHTLTGVCMPLYTITDWLGLIPVALMFGFAVLGLVQWIQRKHILRVDFSILVLGGFYILVAAVYMLFEMCVINYRPILINGYLEASYPSSTTILVLCVIPTTILQIKSRIRCQWIRRPISILLIGFMLFMVIGRLISGVHWLTDIIGGILISAGLVTMYAGISKLKE